MLPLGRRMNSSLLKDYSWPSNPNPSPYEIFNLNSSRFDKKKLRELYVILAKKYHPDSSAINDLTAKLKAERFMKIAAAYDILKDDGKRRMLDLDTFRRSRGNTGNYSGMNATYGYSNNYRDDFYSREPFEGYEQEARRRRYDEKFQENLSKNRMKLFQIVAIAVFAITVVQIKAITKISQRSLDMQQELSLRTRIDELNAKSNYGKGSMQDERIARFLSLRNEGKYYNRYDITDEMRILHRKYVKPFVAF